MQEYAEQPEVGPHPKPKAPFKFNHVWLYDPAYISLVSDFWAANPINIFDSLAKGFCNILSKIKHLRENSLLSHIESVLSSFLDERSLGFITAKDKSHLIECVFVIVYENRCCLDFIYIVVHL